MTMKRYPMQFTNEKLTELMAELVSEVKLIREKSEMTNVLLAELVEIFNEDEQSYTGTMDDDGYDQDDSETL